MEIVSRLKLFLDTHSIPVTQFADRCGIPRPSLSQLLSGRNKKVSDEVITKIHEAYPSLSMMWLMFGEGRMESNTANVNIHADMRGNSSRRVATATPETRSERIDFNSEFVKPNSEIENAVSEESFPENPLMEVESLDDVNANEQRIAFIADSPDAVRGKRVVSIVVYYDDKTFESFFPDPKRHSPL